MIISRRIALFTGSDLSGDVAEYITQTCPAMMANGASALNIGILDITSHYFS